MAAAQLNRTKDEGLGAGASEEGQSFDRLRTNVDRVTRRALLGAALGVPVLRHPGLGSHQSTTLMGFPDPGSTFLPDPHREPAPAHEERWMPDQVRHDDWAGALSAFHAAQAEVHRIEATTAGRSAEEEEAWLPRHHAACAAMEDALARTLAAPAPDLAAFARKLELLFGHCIEPGAVEEEVAEAVMADAGGCSLS